MTLAPAGRSDLLAPVLPGLEDREVTEVSERELPEELGALVGQLLVGESERHPLEVGLHGVRATRQVVPLTGVVVLGALGPGVVGHLVVVEDRDPRVLAVRGLEVAVGLVQGVPQPVALEVDRLGRGLTVADAHQLRWTVAVRTVAVLVDVVAHVQDEVKVVASRDRAVGGEPATGVVAARGEGEPQRVGPARARLRRSGCDRPGCARPWR